MRMRAPPCRRPTVAALAALTLALAGRASAQSPPEAPLAPHVVVGADPDYPPCEFLDRNGQPAGYNVDLTHAIAEVMGMSVEFRFGTWAEIRAALRAGELDVLQTCSRGSPGPRHARSPTSSGTASRRSPSPTGSASSTPLGPSASSRGGLAENEPIPEELVVGTIPAASAEG